MIAIITGDIINSRKLDNPRHWMVPLEELFRDWGKQSEKWVFFRGDSFQVEVADPKDSLRKSMLIKAVLKSVQLSSDKGRHAPIDVRMAIGIGEGEQGSKDIGVRTGPAFFNSGEAFEMLRTKKQNILVKTPWEVFDREVNLMLKLALIVMDNWSINSGELMRIALEHPELRQVEIGDRLGIEQNSVSGRFKRAYHEELLELDEVYREKLKILL
jgi:hypothetical protein